MNRSLLAVLVCLLCGCSQVPKTEALASPVTRRSQERQTKVVEDSQLESLLALRHQDQRVFRSALSQLNASWDNGLVAPVLELAPFLPPARNLELQRLLEKNTGQNFPKLNDWYQWYWSQPERPPAWYPAFKAQIYSVIDPSFKQYFFQRQQSDIDLSEIRWGGVKRDGIPPLANPKMLAAKEASYLADTDMVFGIVHKNDARAYPKRILAWHEMFRDEIGGDQVAGVYCTLCGSVIPYLTPEHVLGTSGFLYRSNKLMYDQKTRSLWSTLEGKPVLGPLRGQGIALERLPVVTTTWGEWKKRYPQTTVLSLETGHRRDYGEGVAYQEYFATDELMFTVPKLDARLKNKAEVLVLRHKGQSLAISAQFLRNHPVYEHQVGDQKFVILTDSSGANRVYERHDQHFTSYDGRSATDEKGGQWSQLADRLQSVSGAALKRLPAHRAFWFAWQSVHPDTELIK